MEKKATKPQKEFLKKAFTEYLSYLDKGQGIAEHTSQDIEKYGLLIIENISYRTAADLKERHQESGGVYLPADVTEPLGEVTDHNAFKSFDKCEIKPNEEHAGAIIHLILVFSLSYYALFFFEKYENEKIMKANFGQGFFNISLPDIEEEIFLTSVNYVIKELEKQTAEKPLIEATRNNKLFSVIRQGNATNALTKLRAIEGKTATIDPITRTATIQQGNFSLSIPNYETLAGLKTSTHQLLDALIIELTETGAKSPAVRIPLSDYMESRGLKDRKEAKAQVVADTKILRAASITGEEKKGKKTESFSFINLFDKGTVEKNGDIVFTFGASFYQMLLSYTIMPYPEQLQTVNNKRNPNSYYFLRRIAEHKNMNVGKKNEDIIAVKTLLKASPYIPTYDDVMKSGKQVDQRIIKPFERDLDTLEDTLTWEYCHSNNEPLTDEELQNMNYSTFIELLIHTSWKQYPDQTARLQRKAERIEQAKAKPKRTKKRGVTVN